MVAIGFFGKFCTNQKVLPLIVGAVLVVAPSYASSQLGTPIPLWSAEAVQDLSGTRNSHAPLLLDRNRAGVTFLDENQLIVHEVSPNNGQGPSTGSAEMPKPFRLHASVLGADSGKPLFSKDWATSVSNTSVDLVSGGILIRTGATLRRLTKGLAEIQDMTFRDNVRGDGVHWDILRLSVSATGRTVLVNRIDQNADESHLDIFDADTLSPRYSWKQSPALYHLYSISDSEIAAADHNQDGLLRTSFGRLEWKQSGGRFKSGCLNLPTFVGNDRVLVQDCERLLLMDEEGHANLLYRLDETEGLAGKFAFSSNGRFVAFCLAQMEVKKHIFSESSVHTIGRNIAVYDLSAKKTVLTVSVAPLAKNDYDFALSPDGDKLAVLNDRRVSVYLVPVPVH